MNPPTDTKLHDRVRQTLHEYRPAYAPQSWQQMQQKLQRQRWRLRALVSIGSLGILFIVGWLIVPEIVPQTSVTVSRSRPRPTILPMADTRVAETNAVRKTDHKADRVRPVCPRKRAKKIQNPKPVLAISTPGWSGEIALIAAHYQVINPVVTMHRTLKQPPTIKFSGEETAIEQQMLTGDFGPDSTSYNTLSRNLRRWPDAVVVCDLTSSMYPYSTQLFAWFRQNARNPAIKGILFFTDCDSLGQQTKPGGPAGRMFVTRDRDVASVLPVMIEGARNTVHNTDDAENDVAALLTAQRLFPGAKQLILIADNGSAVKDMSQLSGVKKPVHVVLCGTTDNTARPFMPDHYAIASRTNGSLHTIDDDLNPSVLTSRTTLRVGDRYYRYVARKNQFRPTPFTHRPVRVLGFIWL